jgi:serine O-acetyltransferase
MLNAIFFYRISRWLYLHHVPFLPKLITLIIFLIYNSKVPYQAEIGKGTRLGYGGVGVIIHSKAKIGSYCSVGQ